MLQKKKENKSPLDDSTAKIRIEMITLSYFE